MQDMRVLALMSQHNHWLQARQSVISSNIAAANIPGYKTHDVKPFEAVLSEAGVTMAVTDKGHLGGDFQANLTVESSLNGASEVLHSGNDVSLEQELMKAGEVNKAYSTNSSVMRKFHQMLLAAVRG